MAGPRQRTRRVGLGPRTRFSNKRTPAQFRNRHAVFDGTTPPGDTHDYSNSLALSGDQATGFLLLSGDQQTSGDDTLLL